LSNGEMVDIVAGMSNLCILHVEIGMMAVIS